jgi:hypothetical protein
VPTARGLGTPIFSQGGGDALPVPLTGTSVVTCDVEVVSCDLSGGAALLDLRTGTYFSINSVGAFVWELLRNPIAVSDLHSAMVGHYDVEQGTCYDELMTLLRGLAEAGLIVIADAAIC